MGAEAEGVIIPPFWSKKIINNKYTQYLIISPCHQL